MIKSLLVHGYFMTNCYLFIDDKTKHSFLIDPGAEPRKIINTINNNDFIIEKILITHGHFDHTAEAERLSAALHAPIYMHEDGKRYAEDTVWNLSAECGLHVELDNVNYFKDDEVFALESNPDFKLKVIHVPGHTPDSVMFYSEKEKTAFVGDSIFSGSIGTSKYYSGNYKDLIDSVFKKILALPDDTVLYSGHSKPTTVGAEKQRILTSLNR